MAENRKDTKNEFRKTVIMSERKLAKMQAKYFELMFANKKAEAKKLEQELLRISREQQAKSGETTSSTLTKKKDARGKAEATEGNESKLTCDACALIIIASISSCVFTINLREILLFAPGLEGKGERKQPVNESIATGTTPRQNTTKDLNGFCVGVLYSCVFLPFVNLRENLLLHLALKASVILLLHLALKARVNTSKP